MLNELEKIRYSRHFLLEGWNENTQEKLKELTVFVAGAGGTGSPTITMLALLGVGRIRICDFDVFEESNKNRQFIHSIGDERVGMNKAQSAAMTVHNINPNVTVEYFDERFDESNIDEMVDGAQLIFDCVDQFKYKFILADCAARKGIPMLFYGIMDYNIFGYIFDPGRTACFHCLFDERRISLIDSGMCRKGNVAVMSPTLFASAGIMVSEAVKLVTGYDEPSYNTFYLGFGKRTQISQQKGVRAFRYWNTAYFNQTSREQGFNWRTRDEAQMFETLYVPRNQNCPYCGKKHEAVQTA